MQRARAERAMETAERILEVAERLFSREAFERVTLDAVAREAGVSIPTLQRRYGSKDGLLAAVVARGQERVAAQRASPTPGALDENLDALLAHYELEARTMWHLIRQEEDCPPLAEVVAQGRALHRRWVEEAFGKGPRERTDALVAATDLFVWKLLRVDLKRGKSAVRATMRQLVDGVLARDPT
jgi:AcrR family transcriptional regulator